MEPDLSISRQISATPSAVFAAITDITRMGEWSPENHANEWKGGVSQAEVGASWVGHNRNGDLEWSTESRVSQLVPDQKFFFECIAPAHDNFHFANWGFEIEAADGGSKITQHWQDLRPEAMRGVKSETSGVTDRAAHNQAGMEATLAALAATLEG